MTAFFLKVLNMGIAALWLILAASLARLLLSKAPKWILCTLWALVAFRLICPFSLESSLSLVPSGETIPAGIAMTKIPTIHSGIPTVNHAVNPVVAEAFTPGAGDSANPLQIVLPILTVCWLFGVAVMLAYALLRYWQIKKAVSASLPIGEGVLACDEVRSPFILGVFRPRIYVSSSLRGPDLEYVILHERTHLARHDHWWKPMGYLLLAVYWFHPLCWLAYVLFCRDLEMACDERVIRNMDREGVAAYSQALLDCSVPRRIIAACPLAFGENGVKQRIQSILNYKKPTFWVIVAAVAVCIAVAVCFLTNPKTLRVSFENIQISWARTLDQRDEEPVARELTPSELDDLREYLAALTVGKEDRDLAGFTPLYSLTVYSPQMGQFMAAGYDLAGKNVTLFVQERYYRVDDADFSEYLRSLCAESANAKQTAEKEESGDFSETAENEVETLRRKYPEYFDLPAGKGLEVYVWQMSEGSYSCGLLPGTNRNKTDQELWSLKGTSIDEMRTILSTYDVREEDILIIPFHNPISSYFYMIDDVYNEMLRERFFARETWPTKLAYANFTDSGKIIASSLNGAMMVISSVRHLPVYKLDTKAELEQFRASFENTLTLDQSYDEVPSFNAVTAGYDDAFFSGHALVLAYVSASSGSYRFGVRGVSVNDGAFSMRVVQISAPESFTEDMAGWFVMVEIPDSELDSCTSFDAWLE